MKTIKHILTSLVVAALAMGCVGDLTIDEVIDPNLDTPDKVLTSQDDFSRFLSGIYTGFATSGFDGEGSSSISGLDGGASQYFRGLYHLNELPTDESTCCWNDQTIKNFHGLSWGNSDVFIYAFYSRVYFQIAFCNEFIRQVNSTTVSLDNKDELIAEARAMRAFCYLHAIDNFGNCPFVTENSSTGAPNQIERADLYNWIESECLSLLGSESGLPDANKSSSTRMDKGVVSMILAKLYLNAEVYTGKAEWKKCADMCESIMGMGYKLHADYADLFCADNNKCSEEIMWSVQQDSKNTRSYGVTNYIIFASTGDGVDAAAQGISSGWGGLRATDAFYQTFKDNDARKLFAPTDNGYHDGPITDVGEWKEGGHPCMKFKNVNADGTAAQAEGFVDTDFPVFRYADVLLMYAECALHSESQVNKDTEGLKAFNAVHERAGLEKLSAYDAKILIAERGRELYQECWRRSDLIRFGLFTSNDFVWDYKGGDAEGTGCQEFRTLYPIPQQDLNANPNLKQNAGY